jgi:hypothetical protein
MSVHALSGDLLSLLPMCLLPFAHWQYIVQVLSVFAVRGLLEFPPPQVAVVVCLFVFGPRLRSLAFLFGLLVFVCVGRYALQAWGSAFRLYAVGLLFVNCRLALSRFGGVFFNFFMFSIQDRAFELNRPHSSQKKSYRANWLRFPQWWPLERHTG